jgi:hypothetical protein
MIISRCLSMIPISCNTPVGMLQCYYNASHDLYGNTKYHGFSIECKTSVTRPVTVSVAKMLVAIPDNPVIIRRDVMKIP